MHEWGRFRIRIIAHRPGLRIASVRCICRSGIRAVLANVRRIHILK